MHYQGLEEEQAHSGESAAARATHAGGAAASLRAAMATAAAWGWAVTLLRGLRWVAGDSGASLGPHQWSARGLAASTATQVNARHGAAWAARGAAAG